MKTCSIAACILLAVAAFAQTQENIPRIVVGGYVYSNATLIVMTSSNAMLRSGLMSKKVNLADLPEPWRAKYYDSKKIAADRAAQAKAEEEAMVRRLEVEAAARTAAARARIAEEKRQAKENEPWVSNSWIELAKPKAARDDYGMTITGTLTSKASKHTLRSLTIRFGVYDNDGNKIGEAVDFLGALAPGETWKFEATASKSGKFSLDRVTSSDGRLD